MYGHSDTVRQLLEGQVRTRPAPYPLPQRPTPPSIGSFRGYSNHVSCVGSSVTSGGRAPSPEVSKSALRPGSGDATEASPSAIERAVFKDEHYIYEQDDRFTNDYFINEQVQKDIIVKNRLREHI
ncbi:hypothetical protein DPMN_187085 [Dreissena polymorpha]|uniref:Uncharacterized protein n=1 Tax=Dreissena polymorpha TaxID=45954 RepID=A0A9D4IA00_DREPO|nr:hypothetical protein DPMN_187085 [Dreissena polymorpha]